MTNAMIVEHRSEGDKYTMYVALDFDAMKEYFYDKYLELYGTRVAENYETWCKIYEGLYGKMSDESREIGVKALKDIENFINQILRAIGSNARMKANAKINFNGIWDTICTIE